MPCAITHEILEAIGKSQRRDTHRAQVERLVHNFVACCEVPVMLEGFLHLNEDVDGLRARESLTGAEERGAYPKSGVRDPGL